MLQALIFDVDGTLADTEEAHRSAFNQAFKEVGCGWLWEPETYGKLLDVSGGKERILSFWKQVDPGLKPFYGDNVENSVDHLHYLKTKAYERAVLGGAVALRPGILPLLDAAHKGGLVLAIATTTTPANIEALLNVNIGSQWRKWISVVEDAGTAPLKKPHPQVYLQAVKRLGLPKTACLVFEDSLNGLQAATAAGLPTIVTPTDYTKNQDFQSALQVLPNLAGVTLSQLRMWHESATALDLHH
jgi:beta-phosphoglucomutase-like phosphatase (HAD superfamily)